MSSIALHMRPSGAELMAMSGPDAEKVLSELPFETQLACIMQVPWKERMRVIMQSPAARELVQSLPAEEVFWMIKQCGIEDSLPLIARTTHDQFQYLIDLDCWQHDQLAPEACLVWYRILGRCNQAKVLEWFKQADDCLLVATLKQFMHVHKIEEESDISEEYDGMPPCTIEGTNFFRFESEDAQIVLLPLLRVLYSHDPGRYQSLVEGIIWDPRFEAEDEALHWRQNRTAENGFPPFDEAIGLYERLNESELRQLVPAVPDVPYQEVPLQATELQVRYALAESRPPDFLRSAVGAAEEGCRSEFEKLLIAAANKVMVADCLEVRDLDDVRRGLRKTAGYISLALEFLGNGNPAAAAALLAQRHPQALFRYGAHLVSSLAERMRRHCGRIWTAEPSRFICFYGSPLADAGLGLSRRRPLFYEGLIGQGSLYRDFESRADIEAASAAVDRLIAADCLLFQFAGLQIEQIDEACVTGGAVREASEITMPALLATLLIARTFDQDTRVPLLDVDSVRTFALRMDEMHGEPGTGLDVFSDQACCWAAGALAHTACNPAAVRELVRDSLAPLIDMLTVVRSGSPDIRYLSSVLVRNS